MSRQQYCLQTLDGRSVFLVGVQCQRCNCTCGTRVSCDALLRISSRTEVTSLNRDLELARWRLLAFPDAPATGTPLLCSIQCRGRHRVLLKIELWDVAPCGWASMNSQGQAVPSCRTAASSGGRTTIDRNVAICNQTVRPALHPDGNILRIAVVGRAFCLALCIHCKERLTAFLSGAERLLHIKNVTVTAATPPAACVG